MLQKDKERTEVEVINSTVTSSVCVSEIRTFLVSTGAKEMVLPLQVKKKRNNTNIAAPVIIVKVQ